MVSLPEAQYEEWRDAPVERSRDFLNQYPAGRLVMTPDPLPPKARRPSRRARSRSNHREQNSRPL